MFKSDQIEAYAEKIRQDGYAIIENAIERDFIDALVADLERLEVELEIVPAPNPFEGAKTVRIYNLLIYGKLYERIPVHEHVLPIVERILDPGCLVSSLSSIAICKDETPQPIHADDQLIPLSKPHVPIVCNSMWALTDFTEANGATRIIPGSHLRDHSPEFFGKYDSIPAEMPKGSVMVYNGSMWHGGGANRTETRRIGVAMNYCAGFIRQQENQQLGIPREIAAQFSPRLQELIGYGLYNGLLGHIDKTHPVELLGSKPEMKMIWDL
ncbi:MAG: phytanoyl-CoA dioxygenase family protein [Candidatus Binatia bacterium]